MVNMLQNDHIQYYRNIKDPIILYLPSYIKNYKPFKFNLKHECRNQFTKIPLISKCSLPIILPNPYNLDKIYIKYDGNQYSLVLHSNNILSNDDILHIWSILKEFWQDNGFTVEKNRLENGFLETNWNKNYFIDSNNWLQKYYIKFINYLNLKVTLDKFRMHIEPIRNGNIEIFIKHYSVTKVLINYFQNLLYYIKKPSNHKLEKIFLQLLAEKFGVSKKYVKFLCIYRNPSSTISLINNNDAGATTATNNFLIPKKSIDYSSLWLRIGLLLDHSKFIIEYCNKEQGIFVVSNFIDKYYTNIYSRKSTNYYYIQLFKDLNGLINIRVFAIQNNSKDKLDSNVKANIKEIIFILRSLSY